MPFGSAAAVVAHDAHAHPVPVQDGAHFLRREIDFGGGAVVASDESMPVAMALHDAFDLAHQSGADRGRGLSNNIFDDKVLCPEMPRWRNW